MVWFSLALYSAAQMILRNPNQKFIWQAEIALPLTTILGCFIGGFFWMSAGAVTEDFPARYPSPAGYPAIGHLESRSGRTGLPKIPRPERNRPHQSH